MADLPLGDVLTGLAVTGNPDSSFTVIWGETDNPDGTAPPGRVRTAPTAPRAAAADGRRRSSSRSCRSDIPGCSSFFDNCFDVAAGPGGTQVALWQQTGQMSASVRSGPGSAWGAP